MKRVLVAAIVLAVVSIACARLGEQRTQSTEEPPARQRKGVVWRVPAGSGFPRPYDLSVRVHSVSDQEVVGELVVWVDGRGWLPLRAAPQMIPAAAGL